MCSRKDYTIIQCKQCGCDIDVWKYDLTRKIPHRGICRSCAMKQRSVNMIAKTDRDVVYLRKQLRNIKSRCSGQYEKYKSYTRKGISVCHEWASDTEAFVQWALSNGWKRSLTIDRIDNDGNYCADNCRWITNKQNILESEVSRKSRGSSKYIGVNKRKDTGKWSVEVRVNKKKINLGCYVDEYEAMMVRERYIIDNNIPYLKRNIED